MDFCKPINQRQSHTSESQSVRSTPTPCDALGKGFHCQINVVKGYILYFLFSGSQWLYPGSSSLGNRLKWRFVCRKCTWAAFGNTTYKGLREGRLGGRRSFTTMDWPSSPWLLPQGALELGYPVRIVMHRGKRSQASLVIDCRLCQG